MSGEAVIAPHRYTDKETAMKKWKCSVCGYVYDRNEGDPDAGVAPGTPFDALPDAWECPVCGAGKSEFEEVEG